MGNIKDCCSVWLDGCHVAMVIFATSFNNPGTKTNKEKTEERLLRRKYCYLYDTHAGHVATYVCFITHDMRFIAPPTHSLIQ